MIYEPAVQHATTVLQLKERKEKKKQHPKTDVNMTIFNVKLFLVPDHPGDP